MTDDAWRSSPCLGSGILELCSIFCAPRLNVKLPDPASRMLHRLHSLQSLFANRFRIRALHRHRSRLSLCLIATRLEPCLRYVRCFAAWFPAASRFGEHPTLAARLADRAGLRDLVLQTFAGNFIHIPFLFFPAFYMTQEVVSHGGGASARRALERYAENARADLVAAWKIWARGWVESSPPRELRPEGPAAGPPAKPSGPP